MRGLSALIVAAFRSHQDVAAALMEAGANARLRDADGMSALMWAAQQGNSTAVDALLGAVPRWMP